MRGFERNRVTSAYGHNNFTEYLDRQIKSGNVISCNKNKADKMAQSLGLQSPPEETIISFDDSIAYTKQNVNGLFQSHLIAFRNVSSL